MPARKTTRSSAKAGQASAGPARRCIVTGEVRAAEGLLRFVRDPEGRAVPDLAGKLPGRGVWVGCSEALVDEAVRRNAFTRSFKERTHAAPSLGADVGRLLKERALSSLGLCVRAGAAVTGYEKVRSSVEAGDVAVLILAGDAAAEGERRHRKLLGRLHAGGGENVLPVTFFSGEELDLAMGRSNVVHAALTSGRPAARFIRDAQRFAAYRA